MSNDSQATRPVLVMLMANATHALALNEHYDLQRLSPKEINRTLDILRGGKLDASAAKQLAERIVSRVGFVDGFVLPSDIRPERRKMLIAGFGPREVGDYTAIFEGTSRQMIGIERVGTGKVEKARPGRETSAQVVNQDEPSIIKLFPDSFVRDGFLVGWHVHVFRPGWEYEILHRLDHLIGSHAEEVIDGLPFNQRSDEIDRRVEEAAHLVATSWPKAQAVIPPPLLPCLIGAFENALHKRSLAVLHPSIDESLSREGQSGSVERCIWDLIPRNPPGPADVAPVEPVEEPTAALRVVGGTDMKAAEAV